MILKKIRVPAPGARTASGQGCQTLGVPEMDGYAGTILYADLSRNTVTKKLFPPELKRLYLGGRGIGVRLVSDLVPADTDPLEKLTALLIAIFCHGLVPSETVCDGSLLSYYTSKYPPPGP